MREPTQTYDTVGIILARGGSKRVPGKNKRILGGHPLIEWTIDSAQESAYLDHIVVSSDDPEIIQIARNKNVSTVRRPDELSDDEASSYDGIIHALNHMKFPFEYVCLLQPTSPFRIPLDIDFCVVSCYEMPPCVVSATFGSTVPNGAVYVSRVDWLRDSLIYDKAPFDGVVPEYYYMPRDRSIDIDTESDFSRAEEFVRVCRGETR